MCHIQYVMIISPTPTSFLQCFSVNQSNKLKKKINYMKHEHKQNKRNDHMSNSRMSSCDLLHRALYSVNNSLMFQSCRSIWTPRQEKKPGETLKGATWHVLKRLRVRFSRWWKKTRTGAFWSPNCSSTCLSRAGTRNTAARREKGPSLSLTSVSCLIVPKSETDILLRLKVWGSVHLRRARKLKVKG